MNTHFRVFTSYNNLQDLCDFIHVLRFVTVSKCQKSPKLMNIVIWGDNNPWCSFNVKFQSKLSLERDMREACYEHWILNFPMLIFYQVFVIRGYFILTISQLGFCRCRFWCAVPRQGKEGMWEQTGNISGDTPRLILKLDCKFFPYNLWIKMSIPPIFIAWFYSFAQVNQGSQLHIVRI